MKKGRKPGPPKQSICLSLPVEQAEAIRRLSKCTGATRSAVVEGMIAVAMRNGEAVDAAPKNNGLSALRNEEEFVRHVSSEYRFGPFPTQMRNAVESLVPVTLAELGDAKRSSPDSWQGLVRALYESRNTRSGVMRTG